jgi:hypothetical protein
MRERNNNNESPNENIKEADNDREIQVQKMNVNPDLRANENVKNTSIKKKGRVSVVKLRMGKRGD